MDAYIELFPIPKEKVSEFQKAVAHINESPSSYTLLEQSEAYERTPSALGDFHKN